MPPSSPCTTAAHSDPPSSGRTSPSTTMSSPGVQRGARRAIAQLVDQPEHADDRRRVDVGAARRVVEADVAADDRDAERLARFAHPVDDLGELPHHFGVLGIPEVEAVHERERPRARARDVARRFEHHQPARPCADRGGRSAPCRRSRARAPCRCPSRAAPRRRRPVRRRC